MKTSKTIRKLAATLARNDASRSEESYTWELQNLKEALLDGRYYSGIDSIAKNWTERRIVIAYTKDDDLFPVEDNQILALAGCDEKGHVHGCGTDMLLFAQRNLFAALAPKKSRKVKPTHYHDL